MRIPGTKKKKMLLSSRSGDGAISAQNAESRETLPESGTKIENFSVIIPTVIYVS